MRRLAITILVIGAIAGSYGLGRRQATPRGKARVLYYVDPMHPAYKSSTPGIAPDCGMQLEPVLAGNGGNSGVDQGAESLPPGAVSIDFGRQRLLGIRLVTASRTANTRTIRAVGRIVPQDYRVYSVNAGVEGFVRGTYQDSVGTLVKKDQKLAAYYAPDFVAATSGFLAASERIPGALAKEGARSLQNYTDRLRNLGMSDVQIRKVAEGRQLPESIDVVSPIEGVILFRGISPGLHFERNMEFYRIGDLSKVWVVADLFDQDAACLRPGGLAHVALRGQGRRWPARVTESLPQSGPGGGTVKVRLEVDNQSYIFRPDMLTDVEFAVRIPPALTVPLDAVVDSGTGSRVYVEHGEGIFEPREIQTGWRLEESVQVLRGVQAGERVVAAATFLVDSESRLSSTKFSSVEARPAAHAMTASGLRTAATGMVKDPKCGMAVDAVKSAADGNVLAVRGVTYYFCSKHCKQAFQEASASSSGNHQSGGGDD